MSVDKAPEPRPIEAKQRALEKFVRVAFKFHHPHHLFYYFYFLTLTHTRPRISLCHFSIHILTDDSQYFLFREALSVNNMVTRRRDSHLKKLYSLSSRHTPRISRGNDVYWRGGKSRAS